MNTLGRKYTNPLGLLLAQPKQRPTHPPASTTSILEKVSSRSYMAMLPVGLAGAAKVALGHLKMMRQGVGGELVSVSSAFLPSCCGNFSEMVSVALLHYTWTC
jgi:hypothetical protein